MDNGNVSKHGLSFQQTRTTAFLQSIALERNLWSERSVMSVGVGGPGSWTEYLNPSERAVHRFLTPADVHSTPLNQSLIVGIPGALGTDGIGGTGWARVFLRVWGVAHKIPAFSVTEVEGSANLSRLGSLFYLTGAGIYSIETSSYTLNPIHGGQLAPLVSPILASGKIGLNVFSELDDISDNTFAMDRIISFSTELPVTYGPGLPGFTWNQLVLSGDSGMFDGGSQPAGVAAYTNDAALGSRIPSRQVCKNALNTTDVLTGAPFFSNPANTIQLLIQRLGFRPESGPRPVERIDLLT